jgi:hypothetical protein
MSEIKLSPVKQVSVDNLKENNQNERFFKPEAGSYFNQLAEDVRNRGIQVPLIAKKCGTLLAGHNRLIVARQIGLKTVPVQYVLEELSKEDEIAYIIKDNVLRRHLTPVERRSLYRFIVPNFEERVKVKNSSEFGIDINDLAEKTGINAKTICYDTTRIRREKEKERIKNSGVDLPDEKAVMNYKIAVTKMLNISVLGSKITLDEFIKTTENALNKLKSTHLKFEIIAEVEKKPKGARIK